MNVDGILNVNKPANITSFGVVSRIKRLTLQKKVGHGGTLDPLATGVLLIMMGQATRVAEYLLEARKTYRAVMELGITTDTYDSAGSVLTRGDATAVTRGFVNQGLAYFKDREYQEPPMFSALRHEGKHLYELAREGASVPREARPRKVYRLGMTDWSPPLMTVELECQGGYYVRSLANDLGKYLGCGAYLKELCRLKCGEFTIENSVSLDKLNELQEAGELESIVLPVDAALPHLKAIILGADDGAAFVQGKVVSLDRDQTAEGGRKEASDLVEGEGEICRVYTADDEFLGVARLEAKSAVLYPKKVLFRSFSPKS